MKPLTQPAMNPMPKLLDRPDRPDANAQPPETLVGLRKSEPKHVAAGIPAIYHAMKHVGG